MMIICYTQKDPIPNSYIPKFRNRRGFEYEIVGNKLIIKAYIINNIIKAKEDIHTGYYAVHGTQEYFRRLKRDLFQRLELEGIILDEFSKVQTCLNISYKG